MRLKTLAGAYAGQVRDYSHQAGQAALRSGTAERIDCETPPAATPSAATATSPPQSPERRRKRA